MDTTHGVKNIANVKVYIDCNLVKNLFCRELRPKSWMWLNWFAPRWPTSVAVCIQEADHVGDADDKDHDGTDVG